MRKRNALERRNDEAQGEDQYFYDNYATPELRKEMEAANPRLRPAPLPEHTSAMYKLDPFHGIDAALRKKLLKIEARERAENEAIQYGPLKARQAKAAAKLQAAKSKSRGTGALNPFLGQAIKKK
jgi:hypothetical protein